MLDPRIYRTGLIAVALAVIVLAFSLTDQQAALSTTLAPLAYNDANAYRDMTTLAATYPNRSVGSEQDNQLAAVIADRFSVSTDTFTAHTSTGTRTIENVIGMLPGQSSGSIVVVAHRDSAHVPASIADLSGTAVLLELARVLSGETQQHSVVLASTSGSVGAAGADRLARALPGPVDAVIVLGDLAAAKPREPILVPWSDSPVVAPTELRNTLAAALAGQASLKPGQTGLAAELLHLAFPMTVSEQGPFGRAGEPAVLLSLAGEKGPAADEKLDPATMANIGRGLLVAISALDGGQQLPGPSSYLLFAGKVIPAWSIRLSVLALIIPALMVMVDGLARVRRRGNPILPGVPWVLSAAVPFALAPLLVLGLKLVGWIKLAPPAPVPAGAAHPQLAIIVTLGAVVVGALVVRRPVLRALTGMRPREAATPGTAAALLMVLCSAALAIWLSNPFAALLLVPALHLWMWAIDPRVPRAVGLAMLAIGLAAPLLAIVYYAVTLGYAPLQAAWTGILMLTGRDLHLVTALEWSVVLGCLGSAAALVLRQPRAQPRREEVQITMRGPITYAGPGSLGGTRSTARR